MKHPITAEPKTIRDIFSKEYIIPEYQRRYSWGIDECEKLWDDIIDYHGKKKEADQPYFLGTIVIYSCEDNKGIFFIIDGQQRLTSLLLLIKAMHKCSGENQALEECLRKKDPLNSKLLNELRVESRVIEGDKSYLKEIIFDKEESNNIFWKNFKYFSEEIDKWRARANHNSGEFSKLVLTLLDHINLLPIKCGDEDDAMTIFQTINDRGMKLDDSDIFKAKIYENTDNKESFIERWNTLDTSLYNQMELFRRYMHILRAKKGVTEKEEALRTFFSENKWDRLQKWKQVMSDIEKIAAIEEWAISNYALWNILYTYPNIYWRYPLVVFLHKYGNIEDDDFALPENKRSDFDNLIEETIKYFFIKGVVHNAVNKVKDTTFKVCKSISNGDDYIIDYKNNLKEIDKTEFNKKIQSGNIKRYNKGLVFIGAYLNKKQDKKSFLELLENDNCHIEHILPKQWRSNYYGNWDKEKCSDIMNKLGNLMPLENKINIKAGNQFFKAKTEHYKESNIQDAIDLANMAENENNKEWLYEDFENRQNEILKRLETFFSF